MAETRVVCFRGNVRRKRRLTCLFVYLQLDVVFAGKKLENIENRDKPPVSSSKKVSHMVLNRELGERDGWGKRTSSRVESRRSRTESRSIRVAVDQGKEGREGGRERDKSRVDYILVGSRRIRSVGRWKC